MKVKITKLLGVALICSCAFAQAPAPKNGYVPDERTAVRIAEAVLSPIYGEETIVHERQFHATLNNGVWTVEGTLAQNMVGGTASIRIDKRTGAILSYIHGK